MIIFPRRYGPLRGGQRVIIVLVIVLGIIAVTFAISAARVRPVIAVLAKSLAREHVIRAVSAAIGDELRQGSLDYSKLVTLEKDERGNITALVTNAAFINLLQTQISDNVVDRIENVMDTHMYIPIGNALGGVIFAGRGPRIPIKIQSVTNTQTEFSNDFSSAGINQTRHKIMLDITIDVDIILPGDKVNTTVETQVAIAETVIVGIVPNVYADIGGLLE